MGKKSKHKDPIDLGFEVQSSAKSKTVVRVSHYEGKDYLDIRKLYLNDEGVWCATRKGIMLPYDREVAKKLRRGIREKMPTLET